jgi:hypothetical protein
MQTLFAISIVSFLAIVWAGIAVARHIRARRELDRASSPRRIDFAQHLVSAVEDESPVEPRRVPYQTLRDITARKSWNQPPEGVTVPPSREVRSELRQSVPEQLPAKRKPPQTAHRAASERLDWAYFNKDMGDLTDRYQTPGLRANARNSPKRF